MMDGMKVISALEMTRIEKDGNPEIFMQKAGREVARIVMKYLKEHKIPKKVTLLVGKGNNGGDAYCAGICLLNAGVEVLAIQPVAGTTPLNKKFEAVFRKKGGKKTDKLEGLLVDGLFGTGFQGPLDEKFAHLIELANQSGLPIISIDIPSGINGTSGKAASCAVFALETVALGLPKLGLFIHDGWNYTGKLHVVDFGLSKEAIASAESIAYIPTKLQLPKIVRNRHKYQAGYVTAFAGSRKMPGAAKLAGLAALKSGAGIVRIFSKEEIGQCPLELISQTWNLKDWNVALKKANSIFIGPGLGDQKAWLKKYLKQIKIPCVIDADALDADIKYPPYAVLTPHRGEVLRLLKLKKEPNEEMLFLKISAFCEKEKVIVVLKGAPTVVFGIKHNPVFILHGNPGMATAGTGDVLTGMIAALLAQGMQPYEGAILGATLHGMAGESAALEKTSYCMTATDVINHLPNAFRKAMTGDIL